MRAIPQACHACGALFSGAVCSCGAERPAFIALKRITAAQEKRAAPIEAYPACPYSPSSWCDCGKRGLCLEAA